MRSCGRCIENRTRGRKQSVADMFHLVKRLVESLNTSPIGVEDRNWVKEILSDMEFNLWELQSFPDQRHSCHIARRFVEFRPQATRQEIAGALLHDIGKVGANMGTTLRIIATLIPLPIGRFKDYLHHEQNGAQLLHAVGSSDTTIALVRGLPDNDAMHALRRADKI